MLPSKKTFASPFSYNSNKNICIPIFLHFTQKGATISKDLQETSANFTFSIHISGCLHSYKTKPISQRKQGLNRFKQLGNIWNDPK